MRKIVFIVFVNILATNFLFAQDQCTPVGWATQNGGVTGGGNATATVVSTYDALKTALTTASVKVVHVSGTITFPANGRINFQDQSAKSIIGLAGARLVSVDKTSSGSGILYIKRCDNIIIRNIIFEGPGAYDTDGNDNMTIDDCRNLWIDHCDFQDGLDGNLDVKNKADYISITWCKFSYLKPPIAGGSGGSDDHRYCNLIGSSDGATADDGKLRITFQYCWWGQGCKERLPRVRFGKIHLVNNYYNSSVANHCIRAGYKADLLIESNVFENVKIPIDKYENNFTAITARNNTFTNTTGNTTGSGTSFSPPYSLTIAPVANVKNLVTNTGCGAGATLDSPTQCGCGTPPVNQNPTTSITAPTNNSSVCVGTALTITATANDADGTISKVDFYNGSTLIGTDNSLPYSISYTPTLAGSLTLKSTATDNSNGVGNSSVVNVTVVANPTATITAGGATTFCTGGSVQLNANTGSGLTYQWRNGTTNISNATNSSYTATAAGSYNVIVKSGNCQTTSSNTTVTVTSNPTATITAGGSTTFCTGGSVQLNANTGSGLTYQWRNGTTNISNATSSSYTATTAGTYNVIVKSGNCQATSSNTTVTVTSNPTATITAGGSTTFCTGGSVQLNANTGSGLTYQWRNGTTNISNATNSSYTATTAGTYNVIVTSGNCQTTSSNTTVTVTSNPTATITAGGSTTFCTGGSVQLNANTGSGLTYQWRNGTTNISNATNSSYTATTAGSYNVIVTSGNCQATSSNTTVTVTSNPTATITAGGSTTFCTGGSVQLNANTGSGLTYQWRNGTTNISNATSSSYTATTAGSYNVIVTSGNCQATSSNTTVTVSAYPSATISLSGSTAICSGDSRTINVTPVSGATYQWMKNNTEITGSTNTSIVVSQAASYSVKITNASSCTTTSNVIQTTVTSIPDFSILPSGNYYLNPNESITIQFSLTDVQYSYQWLSSNNNIVGATQASYSTSSIGTYNLKISNASGCSKISSSLTVSNNSAPSVIISTSSTIVYQPNAINISAEANDTDGSITKVDVYHGNTLMASDNSAPYQFVWNSPDIGIYEFYAVATDNNGAISTSNTISVEVKANRTPVLQVQSTIVPATSTTNSSTTFDVLSSDPDGNTFVVEILQGTEVLQSFTSETSQFVYQNSTPGTYTLTIRVTDMFGNSVEQIHNVTIFGVTTTTGITNAYSISICKIYPNPAQSSATLEFVQPSSEWVDIDVVDLSGRILYRFTKVSMLDKVLLPEELSTGMYLVNIRGGVQATLSFIKQ